MPTLHLRSLTTLRFFAAASVVAYHTGIQTTDGFFQPYAPLRFAYLGVTFFFVLSGFVLVWTARTSDSATSFYRRRFARVWPVHALTLIVAVALGAAGLIVERGPMWSIPVNAALMQSWFPGGFVVIGFNGVSWSLSCEAFFYLAFPFLLPVARQLGGARTMAFGLGWLILGTAVGTFTGATWSLVAFPPYRIGEFVIGMGLALWVLHDKPGAPRGASLAMLGTSYVLLLVINRLSAGAFADRPWFVGLAILPAIGLVLVSFARADIEGISGWTTKPWLVRLGQWSFALYMVHELVLRTMSPLLQQHIWTVVPATAICLLLAGVTYECYERPLERRLRGRERPAVQLDDLRA